jgi:hypothetical protein
MSELRRESKKYASVKEMIKLVVEELGLEQEPACPCRFFQYEKLVNIGHCYTACPAPCRLFLSYEYLPETNRTEYIEKVKILATVMQALTKPEDKRSRWRRYVKSRNANSRSKSRGADM